MKKAIAIVLSVLLIDQTIKIWVKTHMHIGKSYRVAGEWFYLHFVENPGMAFGMQINEDQWGKMVLTVFRLLAVAGIGYYLWTLMKKKVRPLLIVCVALIFAGALGNIVDSVFYGKIFEKSDEYESNVAKAFPEKGGYSGFLLGEVVDMYYFPVITGHYSDAFPDPPDPVHPENDSYPGWFPRAGEEFIFFRPVFNIADASISVGVFLLIIFQRRLFGKLTRLSEQKILATNIFFGVVVFLIATFLLLTYAGMFSETHPLARWKILTVLALSAAAGALMFRYLQRRPVFDPEPEPDMIGDAALPPDVEKKLHTPQNDTPPAEPAAGDNPDSTGRP